MLLRLTATIYVAIIFSLAVKVDSELFNRHSKMTFSFTPTMNKVVDLNTQFVLFDSQ